MNLQEKISFFIRKAASEISTDFPENQIIDLLNDARLDMVVEDKVLSIQRTHAFAAVASQGRYAVPSDWLLKASNQIKYNFSYILDYTSKERIENLIEIRDQIDTPFAWGVWNKLFHIWPRAGTASPTTTVVTDNSTSLVLVNNADFNTIGYIVIGSERIYYQTRTVSGSNMTLGVLTRAENDTVQATHSAGATVTQLDFSTDYFSRGRDYLYRPSTGLITNVATSGAFTAGVYGFGWTYYDSTSGNESLLHDLGRHTVVTDGKINFSQLVDDSTEKSNQKRIYITGAGSTSPFLLHTTIAAGTTSITITSETPSSTEYAVGNIKDLTDETYHHALIYRALKNWAEEHREWDVFNVMGSNYDRSLKGAQSLTEREKSRDYQEMAWIDH